IGLGELPARLFLGFGLGAFGFAAVLAVDFNPTFTGAVARLAGDSRDRTLPASFFLHCVMAGQAKSIGSDALDAHSFCDLARLLAARHLAEGFEMLRVLPGLGLLLVAFGTGIRTDNLCGIVGNGVSRGDSAGH